MWRAVGGRWVPDGLAPGTTVIGLVVYCHLGFLHCASQLSGWVLTGHVSVDMLTTSSSFPELAYDTKNKVK